MVCAQCRAAGRGLVGRGLAGHGLAGCFVRLVAGVTMVAMIAAVGCADLGEVIAARDSAAAVTNDLNKAALEHEQAAGALGEGDPRAAHLRKEAARARATATALDAAIRQVNLVLDEAQDPTSPISAATSAAAPFFPPPVGAGLLLGGALAASLLRAGKLKAALASVVKGIEAAKKDDEAFRKQFQEHAGTFRSIQTPAARRIVDEVTHEGFMVRLPI